jgi:hypothetical protein
MPYVVRYDPYKLHKATRVGSSVMIHSTSFQSLATYVSFTTYNELFENNLVFRVLLSWIKQQNLTGDDLVDRRLHTLKKEVMQSAAK